MWLVQCECGSKPFEILGSALTQKKRPTRRCFSCASKLKVASNLHRFSKGSRPHNFTDLTGQTIGDFLIIGATGHKEVFSGNKNHRRNLWKIRCIRCGDERVKTTSQINRRRKCPICNRQKGKDHPRFKGGPLMSLFRSQKKRALTERTLNNKPMSWGIDYKLFEAEIIKNCFYCGSKPNLEIKGLSILRNTLDRYDSKIGYEPSNIVPCCKLCNLAKRDMHGEEFIALARRIARHLT